MTDKIEELFIGIEKQKRQEINALMSEWRDEIARKYTNEPDPEYWEGKDPVSYFVSDGFFPGYYKQKTKVLFIGRETRYMEGDYIECAIKGYRENSDHNQKGFTRHLFNIVQGIRHNGRLEFEQLKKANDYAKEMVNTKDYGFAYMNISKYTNDTDDGAKANFDFINQFLEDSNLGSRNYFHEELEILDPDIIIAGYLWETPIERKYLDLCFGKIEWKNIAGKVNVSSIVLNGKSVKLLETYAFPDHSHSDKDFFYDPLMEIIFGGK